MPTVVTCLLHFLSALVTAKVVANRSVVINEEDYVIFA